MAFGLVSNMAVALNCSMFVCRPLCTPLLGLPCNLSGFREFEKGASEVSDIMHAGLVLLLHGGAAVLVHLSGLIIAVIWHLLKKNIT